jgi:DNA-directed RNA polymerase subunit RPC12/RpoP
MREVYIEEGDTQYECPYCHTEVEDFTGEPIETDSEEYCPKCGREFKIIVI